MWFMVRLCWFCQRISLLHADQDPKETLFPHCLRGMTQRLDPGRDIAVWFVSRRTSGTNLGGPF